MRRRSQQGQSLVAYAQSAHGPEAPVSPSGVRTTPRSDFGVPVDDLMERVGSPLSITDKGKALERVRRKATGLRPFGAMVAGLPE